MSESELVVYRGVKFRRYPHAKGEAERRYFVPGIADRQRGVKRLHEEVYIAHHGPIPDGHEVHHADHDPLNNDPGNLVAITVEQHRAEHAADARERGSAPAWLAHLDDIRPLSAAWHSSPEGLAWHREHGSASWANREPDERVCGRCGAAYDSRSRKGDEQFCSNRCRSAARRASGVDDEARTCAQCGAEFTVNRYSKTQTCSRSCGMKRSRALRGL